MSKTEYPDKGALWFMISILHYLLIIRNRPYFLEFRGLKVLQDVYQQQYHSINFGTRYVVPLKEPLRV